MNPMTTTHQNLLSIQDQLVKVAFDVAVSGLFAGILLNALTCNLFTGIAENKHAHTYPFKEGEDRFSGFILVTHKDGGVQSLHVCALDAIVHVTTTAAAHVMLTTSKLGSASISFPFVYSLSVYSSSERMKKRR